jgi:hypothetical protein
MSVLSWLLVAPLGLLIILGLAWFEDHVLRPPASPAEQVLQRQGEPTAGTELLSLVRAQPKPVERPDVQKRDSAA